jgi:Cof subfamily protein (haloacid dehalogenase superfamily)
MPAPSIRLLLADVDGTLVGSDKLLSRATIEAVAELHDAGVLFAVTSGRPPRGMEMLVAPLKLTTPIAAFNGGLLVEADMTPIEQRLIPDELVGAIVQELQAHALDVWVYSGADWYVPDLRGAHVQRERETVQFPPSVLSGYDAVAEDVAKLVGVGDDHDAVARATGAVRDRFGDHVSAARSQPYYLDVTHPDANKGVVVTTLAARYALEAKQIATIGDMPNDVLMFARSGLGIAMGNADREVQRAARRVTATNDRDGFAAAVRRFVLAGP